MANVKITELTAATALAGTDVLPIVDVGADATKKVSVSDLLRNLPDGTASAPALAFADDQNTGVLSPGDNSLAFATSGTQRLVIDSSGNVGIGDSSPSALGSNITTLEIKGGVTTRSGGIRLSTSDDSQKAAFYMYDGAGVIGTETAHPLGLYTGNTERLRIDSSGRVGVGTTSPSSYSANNLVIAGTGARGLTIASTDSNNCNIYFADGTAGSAAFRGILRYSHSDDYMRFFTSGSEALVITNVGRVGIGTSSPEQELHVSGPGDRIAVFESDTSGCQIILNNSTGTANGTTVKSIGDNLTFTTSGASTERLRIDSSGNVGIGTTSPGAKLQVQGDFGEFFRIKGTNTGAGQHALMRICGGTTDTTGLRIRQEGSGNTAVGPGSSIFNELNGYLSFGTNNTERLRITSTGQMRLAGAGITFNGDTAQANELDDYEEGTWTPTIEFGGSAVGVVYGTRVGRYVKVGKQVVITLQLIVNNKGTSTGNAAVGGLPFTAVNTTVVVPLGAYGFTPDAKGSPALVLTSTTPYITGVDDVGTYYTNTAFGTAFQLRGSFSYEVA